jgi:glucosamine kinase
MNLEFSLLIADSGSTKTDWVYLFGDSKIHFQSSGLNPFYQSKEEVFKVLEQEVAPHISGKVDYIFFYGAGCADAASSKPISDALSQCFTDTIEVEVASDMLGASRGLCGHEPGVACILGTGANNAVYDGKYNIRSVGSLGFWLGDEGSGSYLGKKLVVHFLQNELPEDLSLRFADSFPEINRLFVLDKAYKQPFPNRFFAAFTRFIGQNVTHPFLNEMIAASFALFIEKYVLKHPESKTLKVHFAGSVAYFFKEILENCLNSKGLMIGNIVKAPMEGLIHYHTVTQQK